MDIDRNKIVRLRVVKNDFDLIRKDLLACHGVNELSLDGTQSVHNPFGDPIAPIDVKGQSSSGKGLSPEQIDTGITLLETTISLFANRKRDEVKQQIKSVCGRKPIIGQAKKQAYYACAKNVVNPPRTEYRATEGMSNGMKVVLGLSALGAVGLLVFGISKMRKGNVQPNFIQR